MTEHCVSDMVQGGILFDWIASGPHPFFDVDSAWHLRVFGVQVGSTFIVQLRNAFLVLNHRMNHRRSPQRTP